MFNLNQLLKDAHGATAIEYGLIMALLSIVMLDVLRSLGLSLAGVFTTISAAMGG